MSTRARWMASGSVVTMLAAVAWVGLAPLGAIGAQVSAPATPVAGFEDARTADLQTRVADLSTRVADLGGADPEALAGRLGGGREGFDASYGSPVAFLGPGQVQYEVTGVGRVAVTFVDGRAERIAIVAPRPVELPLTEPDPQDWSVQRAREIADSFSPADAPLPGETGLAAAPVELESAALGAGTAVADAAGCVVTGPRTFAVSAVGADPERVAAVELILGPPAPTAPVASEGGRSTRGAGAVANSSIGGVVTVNGVSVQALQARADAATARPVADGASWYAVEIALENGSRRPVSFAPSDFLLVDAAGREVSAVCGGVDPAFPLTEIDRSGGAEGWVSFQVPDDFDPERFVVLAPNARVGFDLR